ncbi:LCP family glycopolymer transferase [Cytobacillus purgationiresistens]|uniref:Regulatory protein MsrR n=1 Tax=Cytobacillus purgationiresistens TaxID=863449 RepID=A0ABU0AR23_9BACI|nr:LCP family protein [Cytobacillus purgationiresistens]MDQ0273719.1 LCP family protein required for cell wall assembly [Cytobacillus purgationiresistens]
MLKKFIAVFAVMLLAGCSSILSLDNKDNESSNRIDKWKELKQKVPFNVSKEAKNFLLIGVDSRGETDSRSDAIVLARYEPSGDSIKLVSLMRDSYVKIPDYPKQYSKLNHAYYIGGAELLSQTVEENFDIEIDHTAVIDFKGFIDTLDTIAPDGLEVDVPQVMIDDMNLELSPGKHKLHGEELLSYVRFRHDDQSDFGRVDRQQEVIQLMKEEIKSQLTSVEGIAKSPEMIKEVMKNIETDIHLDEVFALAAAFMLNPISEVESLRIPVANSFEDKVSNHAGAVLQLDFPENISALKEFLNEENDSIEVNN